MSNHTAPARERYRYTQSRELSWLRFNERVLEEAADPGVPALERLKFISIFTSNLDEFFMVRVGSLFDIAHISPDEIDNKTGMTPSEQLDRIYRTVPGLIAKKARIYASVRDALREHGIEDVAPEDLTAAERKRVGQYFRSELLPILSPIIIGPHHPVPHLTSKRLYAAVLLEDKKQRGSIGIVPLPNAAARIVPLGGGRCIRLENILLLWAPTLFGAYTAKESCMLCVTRNADLSFDEDKFEDTEEDFRRRIADLLKRRDYLSVVRLELGCTVSPEFVRALERLVQVEPRQVFVDPCPLDPKSIYAFIDALPKTASAPLLYRPYAGRWPEDLRRDQSILAQVQRRDELLHYPYDSVEPFLTLLSEAAESPDVLSIKITIYRLASSSRVAHILCRAAENGKEVLVLMELRARFDEANNLAWSKLLEEAGCQVIYGMDGFKCHSKICLITLRSRGRTSYITQVGTGNYNEKTNAMYTDLSLMTADGGIGADAAAFFRNMLVNDLEGEYRELCISPYGIKAMLLRQIDRQIALGAAGYICIKVNSVTEREVIDRLRAASRAGVEVQLIVRGICCILPGIPGDTENIHITSIVGRYLEHARIYLFGRGDDAAVYISSADLMTRNLNRRVEIACPVRDPLLRAQLKWLLDAQLRDTAKASLLQPDGSYCRRHGAVPFDSQAYFMDQSPHTAAPAPDRPPHLGALRRLAARLFGEKA